MANRAKKELRLLTRKSGASWIWEIPKKLKNAKLIVLALAFLAWLPRWPIMRS
jgi:hypothetical protein